MEQRLTLINKISTPQYTEGSPLLLEACALYLDNIEKQCIAQLKWKNIGSQTINAIMIDLVCYDAFGHVVKTQSYQYDRLNVAKGQFCGGKTAILLGNDKINKFEVVLKAVSYDNGTVQEYAAQVAYKLLPEDKPQELTGELLGQYKRDLVQQGVKTNVLVNYQKTSGLWQCVCKSWQMDDDACCACGADLEKLAAAASPALLEENLAAYQDKVETERKDHIYEHAQRSMETNKEAACKEALALFESIPGWRDADRLIFACQSKLREIEAKKEADRLARERAEEQARIKAAEEARKRKTRNTVLAVIMVLTVAAFFVVTKVVIPNQKYDTAMELMAAGKYEEAIAAFSEIETHKDSAEQIEGLQLAIKHAKYDAAVALMNEGKYKEAYEAFVSLGGHKDSAARASTILNEHPQIKYAIAKVGSYITFGAYEQDANTSNGKEDIEWLVLAKENNRMLVISRYALDCKPYNEKYTDVTWETCTLRKWLNNDFLKAAFSGTEQAMIPTVTVSADKNPDYSTKPGNATQDKVFLLSIPEANKYFTSDSARQCKPTAYAKKQGAYTSSGGFCWWWLRSPGVYQSTAAHVDLDGGVDEYGNYVNYGYGAVRPALWINLEP